jgi:hypothetical protein
MSNLRRFLSGTRALIRESLETTAGRQYLPGERRDDDLFLVEFPKSGITWLTFLMANINALLAEDRRVVTFFNVNDFIPDVQSVRYAGAPAAGLPGYRCFKSHASYLARYRKVIYMVRDPRDVMVSYWTFLRSLGMWGGTLDQLVRHRRYGIEAWREHVAGWLDGIDAAASFTLVRYEDLIADAPAELGRLYGLLGMPVTEDIIATAVERSSIERMRQLEAEFSGKHPALAKLEFVRRKELGGSRGPLSESLRELIENRSGSVMERLGYGRAGAPQLAVTKLVFK